MARTSRLPGARQIRNRVDAAIRWRVAEAVEPLRHELAATREQAGWTANEMERLQPHVAALDARLEDLRVAIDDVGLDVADGDAARARGILDEVRREHALIRERLGAMGVLEDRLRALEQARDESS